MSEKLGLGYDLFDAVMNAREIQAKNLADKLVSYGNPVIIVGLAYKPNVKYVDGSYSMLVGHYVKEAGQKLFYHDPLCGENGPETDGPYTYLIAHDPDTAFLLSKRPTEGEDITIKFLKGSTIVDPWRRLYDVDGCKVVHYGNTRQSEAEVLQLKAVDGFK